MAQNIYDDPDFHAGYSGLQRQLRGLDGAPEWPTMRSMVDEVDGRRVVDLGCGYGWLGRWAHDRGASRVLGVDLAATMLERARALSPDDVEFRRADLDTLSLTPRSFDIALSSLALHYVADVGRLFGMLAQALVPGGQLVFSIEHPVYSAPTSQEFEVSDRGHRIWPLDRYLVEGVRERTWFVDGVRRQHRTIATYVNAVIDAGFRIDRIAEWGPTPDDIERDPGLRGEFDRPWFLVLAARLDP